MSTIHTLFAGVSTGQGLLSIKIEPQKILRDDVGRVRWIVTADNLWYGVSYATLSRGPHVTSFIEPQIYWLKTSETFQARSLNTHSLCLFRGLPLMFRGDICVNQKDGTIEIIGSCQPDTQGGNILSVNFINESMFSPVTSGGNGPNQ